MRITDAGNSGIGEKIGGIGWPGSDARTNRESAPPHIAAGDECEDAAGPAG
jgi:hypothetical protein